MTHMTLFFVFIQKAAWRCQNCQVGLPDRFWGIKKTTVLVIVVTNRQSEK